MSVPPDAEKHVTSNYPRPSTAPSPHTHPSPCAFLVLSCGGPSVSPVRSTPFRRRQGPPSNGPQRRRRHSTRHMLLKFRAGGRRMFRLNPLMGMCVSKRGRLHGALSLRGLCAAFRVKEKQNFPFLRLSCFCDFDPQLILCLSHSHAFSHSYLCGDFYRHNTMP